MGLLDSVWSSPHDYRSVHKALKVLQRIKEGALSGVVVDQRKPGDWREIPEAHEALETIRGVVHHAVHASSNTQKSAHDHDLHGSKSSNADGPCSADEKKACHVCAVNENGWSPLCIAAHMQDVPLCRLLLGGLNDVLDLDGDGSLEDTLAKGDVPFCDVSQANRDGNTPAHYIVRIVRSPRAYPAGDPFEGLHEPLLHDLLVRIARARNGLASLVAPNRFGETPLHAACMSSNLHAVQFLLKHGADPSLQAENGRTAVDYAREMNTGSPDADAVFNIMNGMTTLKVRESMSTRKLTSMKSSSVVSSSSAAASTSESKMTIGRRFLTRFGQKSRKEDELVFSRVDDSPPTPAGAALEGQREDPASEPEKPVDIDGMSVEEKRVFMRDRTVAEILSTEKDYCDDLTFLVDVWMAGLRPGAKKSGGNAPLKQKEFDDIFSSIPEILKVHEEFFQVLEVAQVPGKDGAMEVATAFLHFAPFFKMYNVYCGNSETQYATVSKIVTRRRVAAYCEKMRQLPAAKKLDLESFLIKPLQRVTRYPLLLRELLKHVPESDAPESVAIRINRAMEDLNGIVAGVNSRKREVELQLKLVELNSRISFPSQLKDGSRLVNSLDHPWDLRSADPPFFVRPSASCIPLRLTAAAKGQWAPAEGRLRWGSWTSDSVRSDASGKSLSAVLDDAVDTDLTSSLSFATVDRELLHEEDVALLTLPFSTDLYHSEWTPPGSSELKERRRLFLFGDVLLICRGNRCEDALSLTSSSAGSQFTIYRSQRVIRVLAPLMHCKICVHKMSKPESLARLHVDPGDVCDCRVYVFGLASEEKFDKVAEMLGDLAIYCKEEVAKTSIAAAVDAVESETLRNVSEVSKVFSIPDSIRHPTEGATVDPAGSELATATASGEYKLTPLDEARLASKENALKEDLPNDMAEASATVPQNRPRTDAPAGSPPSLRLVDRPSISSPPTEVNPSASNNTATQLQAITPGAPSRPAPPPPVVDSLESEPFYFGALSRSAAEKLLMQQDAFVSEALPHRFLVRLSSQPGAYVLSVWDGIERACRHVLVYQKDHGWAIQGDDPAAPHISQTVSELISNHPMLKELRLAPEAGVRKNEV